MSRDKLTLEDRLAIIRETAEPIKKLAEVSVVAKYLYDNAFTFQLNANDTFGYACADSVSVAIEDLPKLLEVEEKFGGDGTLAFMALVEGCEVLKELQSARYHEAVAYLKTYRPLSWVSA
jgi:hypothetical protein